MQIRNNTNLFKLTKNGKISYLYATCHIQHDEVCTISEETKQAFEQANRVVLEVTSEQDKIDSYITQKINDWKMQAQIDTQKKLADYLSISQLTQIAELFDDPSYLVLLNLIETSPMLLCHKINAKRLMNLGLLGSDSLDKQFERQAKHIQKPTFMLDNSEDLAQRFVGSSFTYQEQVDYAKIFLDIQFSLNNEEFKKSVLELVTFYLAADHEQLKKIANPAEAALICASYNKSLMDERDPIFAEAMQPHLDAGDAFIAIGASHIPGVLSSLQEHGCIIEPIQEGNRLHNINTLENKNKSLRKASLLYDFEFSVKCREFQSSSLLSASLFASESNFSLRHKQDLPLFLELIREGKIDRNHEIKIAINDTYNDEELLALKDILQEPTAPKSIDVNLVNISDENVTFISEILRSRRSIVNFNY